MHRLDLSGDDIAVVNAVLDDVVAHHRSVEDPEFVRRATTYAQELPRPLRRFFNDFRLLEPSGVCLVSGYPVDDERIGDTPAHWRARPQPSPTLREEVFFVLCGSLLGDLVGWATQQDQHLVHEVLPIRGHEQMQINSASDATIYWHVEDAFHPFRTEYVGLMCLRNPDATETTFACMDDVRLDPEVVDVLFQPRFVIRPDESHRAEEGDGLDESDPRQAAIARSYGRIDRMRREPEKVAVLFGDRRAPYVRLDPYFTDRELDDREAMAALDRLIRALDERLTGVALQPGQVLFVDNFRAVHGRNPFRARYDGRDRWLKRLNVARDLRKSRPARPDIASRIIW